MMKKEWTNKEYDRALLVIRRWLNSRKFETLHQGELGMFLTAEKMDKVLGFAYTSSGRCAGIFICNTCLYLDKDYKYHIRGFEMDEKDTIYALCYDTDENELLIPIN